MNNEIVRIPIDPENPSIVRHEALCVHCGACKRVCETDMAVGRLYDLESTGGCPICIHCGQCANVCPPNAITEKYEYQDVKKAIADPDKIVVFTTSPSVRVGLGEAFGLEPGTFVEGKMVAALRALGADYVLDTNFAADLTIMEEAAELVGRVTEQTQPLPQFTSCCPAWVKFVETFYPDLIPHLSTAKSPIGMQGATIKTYFAHEQGLDTTRIVNVALTPCTAKKFEIRRPELNDASEGLGIYDMRDMDYVITTRELAQWIQAEGIDFHQLADACYDNLMGEASGAGVIFGNTGGVMEAAARTAYHLVTGENPPEGYLNLAGVRGMDGVRATTIDMKGTTLQVAVAHGIDNAKDILDDIVAGKCQYHFVEVMSCRGGCIGGGGQPKTIVPMTDDVRKARIAALYKKDGTMATRFSHENPAIHAVYDKFYSAPQSKVAEKLLHTTYQDKSSSLGSKGMVGRVLVDEVRYRCTVCSYEHVGELPEDIACPICRMGKVAFVLV